MMPRLKGKVALVTGGSRGIGGAIARAYAREGARVFIGARSQSDLEKAVADIRAGGGDASCRVADISKARDAKRLVEEVCRTYGTLHVLVNNASILGPRRPVQSYPLSAWEEVIRINLTAQFLVTREALRVMVPQRDGSIINVSSGVGRIGKARWGAYAASKFGLEGLTQVLAEEVKEYHVRVNAVNPGATRTEMRALAYPEEDPRTLPLADEIVEVFLYLASPESEGMTGKSFDAREWLNGPPRAR